MTEQVNGWVQARLTINKKQLDEFEKFMTESLQKEIEKAYARAINRLGRNCVNSMKRQLRKSDDPIARDLLGAGIVSVPKTVKRIIELGDPLRTVIGAGSSRKRHPNLFNVVGQPFRVTVSNEKNRRVALIAQRHVDSKHMNEEQATSPLKLPLFDWEGKQKGWSQKAYVSRQSFNGYRNTELPIVIIHPVELKEEHRQRFKSMIDAYMAANHDKVVNQEIAKAVERNLRK